MRIGRVTQELYKNHPFGLASIFRLLYCSFSANLLTTFILSLVSKTQNLQFKIRMTIWSITHH